MHPLFALRSARARSTLLAVGLLAMLLHSLAGLAHVPRIGGSGFVGEICTTAGSARLPLEIPGPGSVPGSGQLDCCKLCCASPPLLVGGIALAVSPAPTSATSLPSRSTDFFSHGARLIPPPRGPPRA